MVEADGGAPVLAAGVSVLLHTVPRSAAAIDAEEAVWRQYNSCVDFSFQETRGNARESCSKFAKPESRHDRLNWHFRTVKSRGLLSAGFDGWKRHRENNGAWYHDSSGGRIAGGFMPESWSFGEDQHILFIFVVAVRDTPAIARASSASNSTILTHIDSFSSFSSTTFQAN